MLIVVDEDIPFAAEAFAAFGDVRALPAPQIEAAVLRDANALIVRSVTPVNATLLDHTRVRFVGTATSGVDHVDLSCLQRRGIAFADASGANANAVAEYVVAALLELHARHGLVLRGATIGIIGCGHVGRRVARYAAVLGLRCVVNDPPLARATCEPLYRPIEEALACDVVTVHVPLEPGGPDPTFHLVNNAFLAAMKPGAFFINTSRGDVADTGALKHAAATRKLGGFVLDVWENEPNIDVELANCALIATAHIAGHSLDAKVSAVRMLASAFAAHTGMRASSPGPNDGPLTRIVCDTLAEAVRNAFDIVEADQRLRASLAGTKAERAAGFQALRAARPTRREFNVRPIALESGSPAEAEALRALGFRCALQTGVGAR